MYLLYRTLLTPLCFIIFNGGALVLSLIWFHLLNLVVRNPKRRQYYARLSVSLSFRLFIKLLCVLCVVKEALRHNFFLKGIVKATGYLANDDPEAFLQQGSACLAQGEDLLIFPEGTRTSRQREFRLRRGAAALAVHSGRPLQVITITLSTEFLSKEKRWYHVPSTCPEYVLSVGEKLSPSELSEPSLSAAPAGSAEGLPENSAMDGATPQAHDADCGPDNAAEPEALSLRTRRLNRRLTEILKHANNGSFKYGT